MANKSSLFTRGYKECRDRLEKNSHFTRSCFNCVYYYQASGDKDECCQNNSVIQYDMVITGNNIYCIHWCPHKDNKDNLFKKSGRALLD